MYAFGPLPQQKRSGRVIGTHQKIDRVARRHLKAHLMAEMPFPGIGDILHFEGSRGPDGIKMKSPGKDEPSHFIDPKNILDDDELLLSIKHHSKNLSSALADSDSIRAAFEAAWLAHAVVDGLTPAHHDSYKEQVDAIGKSSHIQRKVYGVNVIMGGGKRDFVKNNWQYWGAKGVVTTHALFEAGIAAAAKPLAFKTAAADSEALKMLTENGFEKLYIDMIREIDDLQMYKHFKLNGWTHELAQQTTRKLIPAIILAVELSWYEAYIEALRRRKLV